MHDFLKNFRTGIRGKDNFTGLASDFVWYIPGKKGHVIIVRVVNGDAFSAFIGQMDENGALKSGEQLHNECVDERTMIERILRALEFYRIEVS